MGVCGTLLILAAMIAVVAVRVLGSSGSPLLDDIGGDVPLPRHASLPEPGQQMGFGQIREADPAFEMDAFYARVQQMFTAFHAAVAAGDLRPVRRFVDERYYPQLEQQLKAPGDAKAPRLTVESARAMTAKHENGIDTVRVLISAAADGAGADAPPVQEYWTLIRRIGTWTRPELSVDKCPNCGAPIDGPDPTHCAYCGARLADPSLDWVVTRIDAD